MKGQDIEPTMAVILCWYIKGKGRKPCQDTTHLPIVISSASKSQDNIMWDNMIQDWIARYCNRWKSDYKKLVSKKTGLNWAIYFKEKLVSIGHDQ